MSSNNQTINSRTSSSKLSFFKSKAGKIAILILILGGGYYFYQQKNTAVPQINYTLEPVARGSVIAAVSGSGQVSSYNQLDIKPKVSADIISIKVQSGQKVKKGDVLVELDNSDLLTQLKNAQNSLAIAQNNLNLKLIGPTDQDIAISQRSVDSAKLSYDNAVAGLETTKRTLAENLNKAELQVTDTQTNLINTQKDYDNSISSGGIVSQSDTQSLDTAYSSAHSTLSSMQITIRAAVVFADGLLGYNHYGASTNSYQNLLGIRNFQSLSDAQSAYISAEGKMKEFETLYICLK
ncbi:MAG: efflux RND transporter periplasmic adaptor subunit [Candidatus Falkowbacteria bacterium]|nr:efflux RND transporter periplasmic adaptor subunit [Candidatus Falkowbacteria bacterium]